MPANSLVMDKIFENEFMWFLESNRFLMGHQFDDFILSCYFRENDCFNVTYVVLVLVEGTNVNGTIYLELQLDSVLSSLAESSIRQTLPATATASPSTPPSTPRTTWAV